MDNNEIQNYLMSRGNYFPLTEIRNISEKLKNVDVANSSNFVIYSLPFRNPLTSLSFTG